MPWNSLLESSVCIACGATMGLGLHCNAIDVLKSDHVRCAREELMWQTHLTEFC
jgi:hypothetical protein